MKLICTHCKYCNDEEEFFWRGRGIDNFGWSCPDCGKDDGWLEEAVQCNVCGDWFEAEDLSGGVCPYCMWRHITTRRTDIVLGFLYENKDCFGEYASEIFNREFEANRKRNRPV